MPYVLRTDKLSSPHYFAGTMDRTMSLCICIAPVIFDAWFFEDRQEAEDVLSEIGDDWIVSETSPITSGGRA